MKNEKDRFDGFTVNIYLDDDDEWLAHFVKMPNVSAFGESPEEALKELSVAWEGVKDVYRSDGKEIPIAPSRKSFSGQFNVRIDKRIHRALAIEAAQAGVSLNYLVAQKLKAETSNII